MNEKRWALIGKTLVIFSVAVGLILGLFQLTDRLRAPSVFAIVAFRNDHTNPKILDSLKERIETKRLLGLIEERKKKGKRLTKSLKRLELRFLRKNWENLMI